MMNKLISHFKDIEKNLKVGKQPHTEREFPRPVKHDYKDTYQSSSLYGNDQYKRKPFSIYSKHRAPTVTRRMQE